MAVNPSGGSGGFKSQRFLAAAGLPWSLRLRHLSLLPRQPNSFHTATHPVLTRQKRVHCVPG